ncbi:hypothetical protein C0992_001983 [Termitomyces sp. T32_za158]|nr:hypothetical protein C0992_001983 [Termitomyces sp. T32_za158]
MERNCNPRFVVHRTLPAGHKPVSGPPVNAPAARDARYGPRVGQPEPKSMRDAPPRVAPPKATFGGGDAGYRPSSRAARCYNCGCMGHYSKDCKVPRAQVWAAHTAAVESDADAEPEELVNDKEAPQEDEEPIAGEDAESIQIDGDEYVAVDVYDNDYYACDDEEEHMFALTEHQGDGHVRMRHVTLQKAADNLQRPHYTPQEKECLVTYVEALGVPLRALRPSLRITVESHTVVQFGVEVKVKTSGQLTKEYVDIANFDRYDMIIGTPFMRKNKVTLNFVNNKVIINGIPLRVERVVLAFEFSSGQSAKVLALRHSLTRLHHDAVVFRDLVNPMQGPEDLPFVEKQHIPSRFLHIKDDGSTVLHVMCTPDPNVPFDLDQIARYALIFGRPGMENTWQGIAVNFAYRMHWRTLFGFALCRALCTNSAGKTTLVHQMALIMVRPGLYQEAIDAFNKVYDEPFAAQHGPQLTINQVHVPDDKVQNFSDDDTIHVLLYNRILVEWVDHAYTYGVVYLEQQFHHPTMFLDIFQEVDDERLECLRLYGTPTAIPQWDEWRELTKEDHYCLIFKRAEESVAGLFPKANGLYYYIGMDPNVGQLWKQTPAHGTMPSIGAATNIALTDCEMVDVTAAGGPMTPLITESEPLPAMTNIAIEESAKTTEAGGGQPGKKMG